MHHGQNRGNEKHVKYVKKHVNSTKSRGKCEKVGGNNNFPEIWGMYYFGKIGVN